MMDSIAYIVGPDPDLSQYTDDFVLERYFVLPDISMCFRSKSSLLNCTKTLGGFRT